MQASQFWHKPATHTIVAGDITYYHDETAALTVVRFKKPLDIYIQTPATKRLNEVANEQQYRVAINGSFFTVTSEHAGLLYRNGTTTVPLAPQDKQLSAVVSIDASSTITMKPISEFKNTDLAGKTTAFQTGPLVIVNNHTATSSIANSLNGEGNYARTVLGTTASGQTFFAIFSERRTLFEVAAALQSLKLFAHDTITAVNLDGGPSTALYTPEQPQLHFMSTKFLPIIIGIK